MSTARHLFDAVHDGVRNAASVRAGQPRREEVDGDLDIVPRQTEPRPPASRPLGRARVASDDRGDPRPQPTDHPTPRDVAEGARRRRPVSGGRPNRSRGSNSSSTSPATGLVPVPRSPAKSAGGTQERVTHEMTQRQLLSEALAADDNMAEVTSVIFDVKLSEGAEEVDDKDRLHLGVGAKVRGIVFDTGIYVGNFGDVKTLASVTRIEIGPYGCSPRARSCRRIWRRSRRRLRLDHVPRQDQDEVG